MDDIVLCPDCGQPTGVPHDDDCHVFWTENLANMPDRTIRNPFIDVLREVTHGDNTVG